MPVEARYYIPVVLSRQDRRFEKNRVHLGPNHEALQETKPPVETANNTIDEAHHVDEASECPNVEVGKAALGFGRGGCGGGVTGDGGGGALEAVVSQVEQAPAHMRKNVANAEDTVNSCIGGFHHVDDASERPNVEAGKAALGFGSGGSSGSDGGGSSTMKAVLGQLVEERAPPHKNVDNLADTANCTLDCAQHVDDAPKGPYVTVGKATLGSGGGSGGSDSGGSALKAIVNLVAHEPADPPSHLETTVETVTSGVEEVLELPSVAFVESALGSVSGGGGNRSSSRDPVLCIRCGGEVVVRPVSVERTVVSDRRGHVTCSVEGT